MEIGKNFDKKMNIAQSSPEVQNTSKQKEIKFDKLIKQEKITLMKEEPKISLKKRIKKEQVQITPAKISLTNIPVEKREISKISEVVLDDKISLGKENIDELTWHFPEIDKLLKKETKIESLYEFEIQENKQELFYVDTHPLQDEQPINEELDKVLIKFPEINQKIHQLEQEIISDPMEEIQLIWKELKEAEKAKGQEQIDKISNILSMIFSAVAGQVTSHTVTLENTPLIIGPKAQEYKEDLEKLIEKFSTVALTLDGGSSIVANVNVVLTHLEMNRMSENLNDLQVAISKKMDLLVKDPENEQLKKEISYLKTQYLNTENALFDKTMNMLSGTMLAPINALSMACENLIGLLPSTSSAGLQSAVNILSFLGGSVGIVTASVQINKCRQNLKKIGEVRDELTQAVEKLRGENVPERVLKMMEMRIENLGKGRTLMEVSNLVAAIIKWAGTSGSTAKSLLLGTSLIKGAMITKVGTVLSAGTLLIPAVIGGIAYLRLQRANIWKSFKNLEDQKTLNTANSILEREGKHYHNLIQHPYYEFTQKVSQWTDRLDRQDVLEKEMELMMTNIIKNMDEKTYNSWKKESQKLENHGKDADIIQYATEEQKNELVKLRDEYKSNNKEIVKFKSEYYYQMTNSDIVLCNYVKYMEQLRIDPNNKGLKQSLIDLKLLILPIQSRIEAKASEQRKSLRNLLMLHRWHTDKISNVEEQYVKKMVLSHTKLNEKDVENLKQEVALLWKDPQEQKEIKNYFYEHHQDLYGELTKNPVETLVKWVAGISL